MMVKLILCINLKDIRGEGITKVSRVIHFPKVDNYVIYLILKTYKSILKDGLKMYWSRFFN